VTRASSARLAAEPRGPIWRPHISAAAPAFAPSSENEKREHAPGGLVRRDPRVEAERAGAAAGAVAAARLVLDPVPDRAMDVGHRERQDAAVAQVSGWVQNACVPSRAFICNGPSTTRRRNSP
jgi:hypothetical protein